MSMRAFIIHHSFVRKMAQMLLQSTAVCRRRITKTQTWFTVMTGLSSSFWVGVPFRAILLCLLDGCIYTLTVGMVLDTNVFQINLGELLFRATLKVRLGSCLSSALKMDKLDCTKINAHFKNSQLVYGRSSFTSGSIHC